MAAAAAAGTDAGGEWVVAAAAGRPLARGVCLVGAWVVVAAALSTAPRGRMLLMVPLAPMARRHLGVWVPLVDRAGGLEAPWGVVVAGGLVESPLPG